MNILILYNATQTYTNAVYEHLESLRLHSSHSYCFAHADQYSELNIDLALFDAIGIHFTVRLPFDQISPAVADALGSYRGFKFLFIQDEYDFTNRASDWIRRLSINLVFTVVPEVSIETVYPQAKFPSTRFVSNLTGYVPETLSSASSLTLPSSRSLMVGYRGRPLPVRYGQLGFEKVAIGKIVKDYCDRNLISSDIAWSEEARIYGPKWYEFVCSCRAMLGSESGSNVFDWDGDLSRLVDEYRLNNPNASDEVVYHSVIRPREIDGIMNQLSPRIFESIAANTVLVLFEGEYSGVILPWKHFIPLKKDGSNLDVVMSKLADDEFVDRMAADAYEHVIASGRYSYKSFAEFVDFELAEGVASLPRLEGGLRKSRGVALAGSLNPTPMTTFPIRSMPRSADPPLGVLFRILRVIPFGIRAASYVWRRLPEIQRHRVRQILR